MTIRYEANPPKITTDTNSDGAIKKFVERIVAISEWCDAVHITENVLGYQRVSPITVAEIIRDIVPNIPITVSLRVRDKTEKEISEFVQKCITIKCSGILVLMGDPSRTGVPDSGQIPSKTVTRLKKQGIDSEIDLYLSIPNAPNISTINRKMQVTPKGFMTQVISNIEQVRYLAENLKGFSVIPIMLYPSEKNQRAAEFLNMELEPNDEEFAKFVSQVHKITRDVLITSPGDFEGLNCFLSRHTLLLT